MHFKFLTKRNWFINLVVKFFNLLGEIILVKGIRLFAQFFFDRSH